MAKKIIPTDLAELISEIAAKPGLRQANHTDADEEYYESEEYTEDETRHPPKDINKDIINNNTVESNRKFDTVKGNDANEYTSKLAQLIKKKVIKELAAKFSRLKHKNEQKGNVQNIKIDTSSKTPYNARDKNIENYFKHDEKTAFEHNSGSREGVQKERNVAKHFNDEVLLLKLKQAGRERIKNTPRRPLWPHHKLEDESHDSIDKNVYKYNQENEQFLNLKPLKELVLNGQKPFRDNVAIRPHPNIKDKNVRQYFQYDESITTRNLNTYKQSILNGQTPFKGSGPLRPHHNIKEKNVKQYFKDESITTTRNLKEYKGDVFNGQKQFKDSGLLRPHHNIKEKNVNQYFLDESITTTRNLKDYKEDVFNGQKPFKDSGPIRPHHNSKENNANVKQYFQEDQTTRKLNTYKERILNGQKSFKDNAPIRLDYINEKNFAQYFQGDDIATTRNIKDYEQMKKRQPIIKDRIRNAGREIGSPKLNTPSSFVDGQSMERIDLNPKTSNEKNKNVFEEKDDKVKKYFKEIGRYKIKTKRDDVTEKYYTESEQLKGYKTTRSEEINPMTDDLWFDDERLDTMILADGRESKQKSRDPATHTVPPTRLTRERYTMTTPNYYGSLPTVAERYNFDEPLPEKDRERETIKSIPLPPSTVNRKVQARSDLYHILKTIDLNK